MPVEVHRSRRFYRSPEQLSEYDEEFDPLTSNPPTTSPTTREEEPLVSPVKFRFQHDLESLWWVALWILLCCVGGAAARILEEKIYTYSNTPSNERVTFFVSRGNSLSSHLREELRPLVSTILDIRGLIRGSYEDKEKSEKYLDHETYRSIYKQVWGPFGVLFQRVKEIKGVDFQSKARPPP